LNGGGSVSALEQLPKLLGRQSGLFHNGGERTALEVFVVKGDSDAGLWPVRVFENIVAAGDVVNEKTGTLERSQECARLDGRQAAHTN
jgi:hypothetical protein